MDLFSVFTLCGGLAFFLYGMTVMSSGLEKMAGGKLTVLLKRMTSNPVKSLLLGAGITIAIQSSSAMTVMLVGLVNSGIMELGQTVGVIMGSNIGTTLTAWILSLAGLESDNFFLRLLKPESFSPVIALIGIMMIMVSKKEKRKDIGSIFVGFAVLMYGMELMSDSVSGLSEMPQFESMLTAFSNPVLGVLVGAVFTGIIQSSAASVGILQALSLTGSISFGVALPIIMGQNIGTCVTALLSSIGVNKNAKRVSVVHISFNLFGTVIFLVVLYGLNAFLHFEFFEQAINPFEIALCHSIFNIVTTILLLPFSKQLVRLACVVIPDREAHKAVSSSFLDERLLHSAQLALSECHQKIVEMARTSETNVSHAIQLIDHFDPEVESVIDENENKLDQYEDALGSYLLKVSSLSLTDQQNAQVSEYLHLIGDFERIGDHAVNLYEAAKEIHDKNILFSKKASRELGTMAAAVSEILSITVDSLARNDAHAATRVEPLEEVIDMLSSDIRTRHVERLKKGNCTIELGFILSDLLTNYERISDHCSNIAVQIIQTNNHTYGKHDYLTGVKNSEAPEFESMVQLYHEKYNIN